MVGTRIVEGVIGDTIKNHPVIFIFAAAVAFGIIYYSYSTFALKAEVVALQNVITNRLIKLELKGDKRDIETEKRSIESEIFELRRIEFAHQATRRDLRRLYKLDNRRSELIEGLKKL